jgi:hypothetical protein
MVARLSLIVASILLLVSFTVSTAQSPDSSSAPPVQPPTDPGWPPLYTKQGTTLVLHQPQVDAWKDLKRSSFAARLR